MKDEYTPIHIAMIPTEVSLSYREWDVELMEQPAMPHAPHGMYDPYGPMFIQTDDNALETVNTFMHEMIHAIFHLYNINQMIGLDMDTEEKICGSMGNGLTELFARNPKIIKFLWESLHGGKPENPGEPDNG